MPMVEASLSVRVFRLTAVLAVALAMAEPGPAGGADGEEASSLGAAFQEGTFSLGLRYRYEQVSDDRFQEDALASTLRTTIGYRTKPYHGFAAQLEVEDVTTVGGDAYDNGGAGGLANGVVDRPVVADPEILEFNQAFLAFTGLARTALRFGRFEWNLDNERFVGAVGWRQNHQSFDAFAADIHATDRWRVQYVYLDRVHTVTGARQPLAGHLLNAGVDTVAGRVVGYGYLLDYDQPARFRFSTRTLGGRVEGKRRVAPAAIGYLVEYARQEDLGDNPKPTDAAYLHTMVDASFDAWTVRLGYEAIEGDGEVAFQFPLGTNHLFNGFADQFLVTPAAGLDDLYGRIAWRSGTWQAFLDYHRFDAYTGGAEYGDELDLQVSFTTSWKQQLALKAAYYEAQGFGVDTTKVMFWTSWGF